MTASVINQQTENKTTLPVHYEKEVDITPILNKKVAVIGFGGQGYGQSQNLQDAGCQVKVALREDSPSVEAVKKLGLQTMAMKDVADWADVIVFLCPDLAHGDIYKQHLEDRLTQGQTLVFCHGFSILYNHISPPPQVNVVLASPKGQGHKMRAEYLRGRGVAALVAVHQDATGDAFSIALAYAAALGCGRVGIFESSFKDETETNLFSEQVVLCGGLTQLITKAFEVLVEAGYPKELAYFCCLHEVKLLADLIYEKGITGMRKGISDTARYGDVSRGPRVIDEHVKQSMNQILTEVQSGAFAKEWMAEYQAGMPKLNRLVEEGGQHDIDQVGQQLRHMMNWD